ncbi:hypothetical protein AB5J56_39480 [Streptomyces sp. R21]|uniref:Uncharacterized protein n=1 Tax=Streptomyces sp. R21 TaxID=3238627 RepID=A0AB39PHA4_9ACTN
MTTLPYEVPESDTTLLTFDGRVLELFGFGDAHRLHIRRRRRRCPCNRRGSSRRHRKPPASPR